MSDVRVTFRLDSKLRSRLRRKAKLLGRPESEIVRAAVERELNVTARPRTFYDALVESGFIGCIPDAPRDLSTNKKYMEGFGEWESDALSTPARWSRWPHTQNQIIAAALRSLYKRHPLC